LVLRYLGIDRRRQARLVGAVREETGAVLGEEIGDLLAENKELNIGLNVSTLITGIVFVSVLLFWRSAPNAAPAIG
jgi:hypothetical protein